MRRSSTSSLRSIRVVTPLACAALAVLVASPVRAAGQPGLTPGLWYVQLVSQSIDGHELPQPMLASISPTDEQILEADAALGQNNDTCTNGSLPDQDIPLGSTKGPGSIGPESHSTYTCTLPERVHEGIQESERLQDIRQNQQDRPSGNFQICVTPEMAQLNTPILDREGICRPTVIRNKGKRETFQFRCSPLGSVVTGTGQSTLAAGRISSRIDATVRTLKGDKHTVKSQIEMSFVSTGCGSVKAPTAGPTAG